MKAFPTVDSKRGGVPSPERSSKEKSSESAPGNKTPPRTTTLCTVIESLEPRAMLAGVGPESWSAPGLAPAPLGTGVLSSSGIILTCSSPAPGSSGAASPPTPTSGSGGTTSGGDLWDSFSAGSGAGGSTSGSTGGVSTDGPALSSPYNGGSGVGSITPLVYNPESDGPPVFHSGVFTGDHGSVQFVQTADSREPGNGRGGFEPERRQIAGKILVGNSGVVPRRRTH